MHKAAGLVACLILVVVCGELNADEPSALARTVPEGAEVVELSADTAFRFTEGPSWDRRNGVLYFSDIPNERIMKLLPDGTFSVFREPSGAANGLMFDAKGNLISCDGGGRQVSMLDSEGNVTKVLAESYNGKKLNSPNDLVIDSKGGIYFTDPRYGNRDGMEQDVEAVYYLRPDGTLIRVVDDVGRPNGVILSPDGKTLYVADTSRDYIRAYDVQPDGMVTNGRDFGKLPPIIAGKGKRRNYTDGMTIDVEGNLYAATGTGIEIFDKAGKYVGVIEVPKPPANCAFGGPDNKTLFITARTSVYKIGLKVAGVRFPLER
jgi:gluconolactonase